MIASREDAVGLFSKWATEASLLSAVTVAGGIIATFNGVASSIVDHTVVIANDNSRLTVDLTKFDEFEYADVREAPPEIKTAGKLGACLTIKSEVTTWRFYERADFDRVTLL